MRWYLHKFYAVEWKIYKSSYRIYSERAGARAFDLSIFRFSFFCSCSRLQITRKSQQFKKWCCHSNSKIYIVSILARIKSALLLMFCLSYEWSFCCCCCCVPHIDFMHNLFIVCPHLTGNQSKSACKRKVFSLLYASIYQSFFFTVSITLAFYVVVDSLRRAMIIHAIFLRSPTLIQISWSIFTENRHDFIERKRFFRLLFSRHNHKAIVPWLYTRSFFPFIFRLPLEFFYNRNALNT